LRKSSTLRRYGILRRWHLAMAAEPETRAM
jgi:hypothetical protein